MRTGDGLASSGSSVTGGESWKRIRGSDRTLFKGSKSRYFVPLQYRIRRASVLITADTYETAVIFSITAS